ncbi:MATE family efflux transporter [Clostridium sp. SYSU_GA19001]|uniref:MATE family efflux transporter n=1 Tax=Clostridium caldaquaticum TaxID=2940653 RepID=UPI002077301E|nr:MATE family efflux transporter [Clostridium caldaquaticum]MCM8711439.1 MATE family efflux transporter [Clostridium caldaquaticum]
MKLIKKDVLKLAMPILWEQVFVMSMGMINTIMAGNLGKEAVSAIGMVNSINNIFIAFFSALSVGGTVVVAQFIGQGNIKKANASAKQALYASILLSLVITIITWIFRYPVINILFGSAEAQVISSVFIYLAITLLTYPLMSIDLVAKGVLRGAGDTKTPMMITIYMNIVNVVLSYVLIYGIYINNTHFTVNIAGMGITGAALGIAISRALGTFIIMYILLRGSRIIKLTKLTVFNFDKELLNPIFNIGIPASIESLLFNCGKLITQIYIVSMGTVAIASNAISDSIASMLNIPGMALSIAATAIVGQKMGKGKSDEAESSLKYLVLFSTLCLTILGLISAPLSTFLTSLYTSSMDVINLSSNLIKINALFIIAWSCSFVLPAGLKGAGDVKYTMITAVIGMWIFRITLGYFLGITFGLGLIGVWLGMYIDWIVRGALYLIRLKNGKWKNHVVIKATS